MTDLYDIGTVVKLRKEPEKAEILLYRGKKGFEYRFLDITPNSSSFGIPVIWSEDSEFGEWAAKAAKKIGKLSPAESETIISNPKKAAKLLEILLK